jgi:hypothetical protein
MKSALIGIVAVVVIGGGGYLLMQKGGGEAAAMMIMDKASQAMITTKSYTTKGEANLKMSMAPNVDSELEGSGVAKIVFTGAMSREATGSTTSSLGKGMNRIDMDINFDLGGEKIVMKPSLDLVYEDKVLFMKLDLPTEVTEQYPFVTSLNQTWIKVDLDEFVAKGLIAQADLDKITAGVINQQQDPEMAGKIKEAINTSGIFKNVSVKSGEMIDGLETTQLLMSINTSRISEFVLEFAKIADPDKATNITDEEKKQLDEMEIEVGRVLKSSVFTITVEKETGILRGVTAVIAFADSKSGVEGTFDVNVAYNDINKPVVVELPKTSTSIMEIIAPFIGAFMPAPVMPI